MMAARPAFNFQTGYGSFYVTMEIDDANLAAEIVRVGVHAGAALVVTLGAFYLADPQKVKAAVRNALAGLVDIVRSIRSGSVLVDLCFHTRERFLAFMEAFATGKVKERLQDELFTIGFKNKLELTITVYDNESQMRKETEENSSDFDAASESSGVESMESDDEFSPQRSRVEPLTPPLSDLEGEELAEGLAPDFPKSRLEVSDTGIKRVKLMTAAAGSPSVKAGTPSDNELEELAFDMAMQWRKLGHRLGVADSVHDEIDLANEELSEKAYHMLMQWKRQRGSGASYKALSDALLAQRGDLSKKFCSD